MNGEQDKSTPAANDADTLSKSKQNEFDVIVVGAGLAGCTAARLFAIEGLRVGLVESHRDMRTFHAIVYAFYSTLCLSDAASHGS